MRRFRAPSRSDTGVVSATGTEHPRGNIPAGPPSGADTMLLRVSHLAKAFGATQARSNVQASRPYRNRYERLAMAANKAGWINIRLP